MRVTTRQTALKFSGLANRKWDTVNTVEDTVIESEQNGWCMYLLYIHSCSGTNAGETKIQMKAVRETGDQEWVRKREGRGGHKRLPLLHCVWLRSLIWGNHNRLHPNQVLLADSSHPAPLCWTNELWTTHPAAGSARQLQWSAGSGPASAGGSSRF